MERDALRTRRLGLELYPDVSHVAGRDRSRRLWQAWGYAIHTFVSIPDEDCILAGQMFEAAASSINREIVRTVGQGEEIQLKERGDCLSHVLFHHSPCRPRVTCRQVWRATVAFPWNLGASIRDPSGVACPSRVWANVGGALQVVRARDIGP